MLVDPKILVEYAIPIALLVLTILVGQSVFGTFSFMLGGESLKSAMRCGFSMAQIGEFSFIIASLGLSLGVISDVLRRYQRFPISGGGGCIGYYHIPHTLHDTACHTGL